MQITNIKKIEKSVPRKYGTKARAARDRERKDDSNGEYNTPKSFNNLTE